ncbi:nucleoid-associated protein [Chitinibacter sp. S2-10]|uniref:nucleoid-associated protein n=1 Tax=Chitinibacter sp. S2-10 TaxID=3373597 RepID=UPI0039777B10
MEIQLNNPIILKMAMHVVGEDGEERSRHLPATDVVHQEFFLGRIQETIKGCKCEFLPASGVYSVLKGVKGRGENFNEQSINLADLFHLAITSQGGAVPGAFLLFEIENNEDKIYSIIKYEHDDVVHYKSKINERGEEVLDFELLDTTFVKKPQAMQKSALISFSGEESIVYVIDRSERKGITKYFRNYLGVVRLYDDLELTEKFQKVVDSFVKFAVGNDLLPKEIRKTYKSRLYEYSQRDGARFDPDEIAVFLGVLVGDDSPALVEVFERELKKGKIEGEKFEFDKESVKKPSKYRTKTLDGIVINFDQSHIDSGKYRKEGETIVIDISNGLEEDADQLG